ncbi:MAG: fibrillarin-like rRNA/tRNA 2'-O-methyltransferase [Archaeoglobaceae archaeon]
MTTEQMAHNIYLIEKDGKKFLATKCGYPPYHGEKKHDDLREWIAWRSKFAAMALNGYFPQLEPGWKVLYLGASSGTTLSHFSDVFDEGMIYAVEYSPKPFSKLLGLAMERKNIIPLLEDASRPWNYNGIVEEVDFVYQDIAHKEQIKIFTMNANMFLKAKGSGLIMVKARSIDSTAEPDDVFNEVIEKLSNQFNIIKQGRLDPYHKDHKYIHVVKE